MPRSQTRDGLGQGGIDLGARLCVALEAARGVDGIGGVEPDGVDGGIPADHVPELDEQRRPATVDIHAPIPAAQDGAGVLEVHRIGGADRQDVVQRHLGRIVAVGEDHRLDRRRRDRARSFGQLVMDLDQPRTRAQVLRLVRSTDDGGEAGKSVRVIGEPVAVVAVRHEILPHQGRHCRRRCEAGDGRSRIDGPVTGRPGPVEHIEPPARQLGDGGGFACAIGQLGARQVRRRRDVRVQDLSSPVRGDGVHPGRAKCA